MKRYDINSYEHWFYDHSIRAFHFKSDDGKNLYFNYIVVGSYSTKQNTWMWSWSNTSTPKHIVKGLEKVRALHEAFESNPLIQPEDDYWAWCNACEQVWLEQGEWNETVNAASGMKIVCDQCYFGTKRRNQYSEAG
jgi:hypothetical protein